MPSDVLLRTTNKTIALSCGALFFLRLYADALITEDVQGLKTWLTAVCKLIASLTVSATESQGAVQNWSHITAPRFCGLEASFL
jgi:hypothetical protein